MVFLKQQFVFKICSFFKRSPEFTAGLLNLNRKTVGIIRRQSTDHCRLNHNIMTIIWFVDDEIISLR